MLFSSASQQERPRELKGAGHLLGETAERFFSEDVVGQTPTRMPNRGLESVRQLAKAVNHAAKANAKDICSNAVLVKQQATSGATSRVWRRRRQSYETDTFTLDGATWSE